MMSQNEVWLRIPNFRAKPSKDKTPYFLNPIED